MNPYIVELLAKERQRELDEDIKRIHLARTVRKPVPEFLKNIYGAFVRFYFQCERACETVIGQLSSRH